MKEFYFENKDKKVLLRENKRLTARRVASTPSVVLARGGTPSWVGTPFQDGRYPPS